MSPPRSFFTTEFQGGARSVKLRLQNLLRPHSCKRGPLFFSALLLIIALSGSLVACRPGQITSPALDDQADFFFDTLLQLTGSLQGEQVVQAADLDRDGQLELVTSMEDIGLLKVYQLWPDGSLRSQELRAAAGQLLDVPSDTWVGLTYRPGDGAVEAWWPLDIPTQWATLSIQQLLDRTSSGRILLPAQPWDHQADPSAQSPAAGVLSCFYEGLTLDGVGDRDDSLTVTSYGYDLVPEGLTELQVTLGTGEELSWQCSFPCSPQVFPAHLTSQTVENIVLELTDRTSNYGAAFYSILGVKDGLLQELARLTDTPEESTLPLPYPPVSHIGPAPLLLDRADCPLQSLQIPLLYDKWSLPCYGALTYTDGVWSLTLEEDSPIPS
jgi:hypothetical protein